MIRAPNRRSTRLCSVNVFYGLRDYSFQVYSLSELQVHKNTPTPRGVSVDFPILFIKNIFSPHHQREALDDFVSERQINKRIIFNADCSQSSERTQCRFIINIIPSPGIFGVNSHSEPIRRLVRKVEVGSVRPSRQSLYLGFPRNEGAIGKYLQMIALCV